MTTTITPYRAVHQAGRDGFAQLLRAEWTKFRTMRGWVLGVIIAAVLIDLVAVLAPRGSGNCGGGPGGHGLSGAACLPVYPIGPGGEAVNDSFYFVRQPLAGNGSITVQVTSLTGIEASGQGPGMQKGLVPWAKAGIIIKQGTQPGSPYAAMMVTGSHGVRMQYNYTADIAGLAGPVSAAPPRWLRLTRSGDAITGYDSADGHHWAKVGTVHLTGLSTVAQAGLFVASPMYAKATSSSYNSGGSIGGPSVATGVFDHLSLHGAAAGARWTGQLIGAGSAGDGRTPVGFRLGRKQFTVTGVGDISPLVSGFTGAGTIADHLFGVFIGLTIIIILAVMFITAEYRRGLIRTTLAASPRRGRMLAAKAVVIGAVTFVLGITAAAAAVRIGLWISRDTGMYVLPVGWQTELRVTAGTGALLAVAGVLALALGTILRRGAAAVGAAIVAMVLPYVIGLSSVLPAHAAMWLLRVSPAAAFAIQQSVPQYPQVFNQYGPPDYYPLAPWAGLAVLCGYAAVAMALAFYLLRRRDV
jgi:ABC-type transport system involved in multi-copper enzyme maturation permease subunit